MADHFIHPTAGTRATALLKLGASITVVSGLGLAARLYTDHVAPLPICNQLPWIRLVAVVGILGLLALAVLFYRNGLAVWRSGQFPAPGTPVIFAPKISMGWRARVNATTLFLFAALSVAALVLWCQFFAFSQFSAYVLGLRRCEI